MAYVLEGILGLLFGVGLAGANVASLVFFFFLVQSSYIYNSSFSFEFEFCSITRRARRTCMQITQRRT